MARPQTEDGFAMLACELLAALMVADFNAYERVILSEMILASYGPAKAKVVSVDHIQLAKILDHDPRNFRRAIRSLVACGTIEEVSPLMFRLVKDWERWLVDPKSCRRSGESHPRIDQNGRRYVAFATGRHGVGNPANQPKRSGSRGSNRTPTDPLQGSNRTPTDPLQGSNRTPESEGSRGVFRDAKPDAAIESETPLAGACPRPSEEFKNLEGERGENSRATPPPCFASDSGTPTPPPTTQAEIPSDPAQPHPGDSTPPGYDTTTPAERLQLEEAAKLAATWFPDRFDVIRAVTGREGSYPPSWYLAAIRRIRDEPRSKWKRSYLMGVLRGFEAEGGPPPDDPKRVGPTSPAAVAPFRASDEDREYMRNRYKNRGAKP